MAERLIDLRDILNRVPWSESTIRRRIQEGQFPKGRLWGGKAVWRESEIDRWIDERFPPEPAPDSKPQDAA